MNPVQAPEMNNEKQDSERRFPGKNSENQKPFPGANLILRPA